MKLNDCLMAVALAGACAVLGCASKQAPTTAPEPAKITIDTAHPSHAISPTLWGVFLEDVNCSADGGIYPELVRNRSFEDAETPENWTFASAGEGRSEASVISADAQGQAPPLNPFNRRSLRITAGGAFTLQNGGYWGMNMAAGDSYRFSVAVRAPKYDGTLTAKILGADGAVLASGDFGAFSDQWHYHFLTLKPAAGDAKARLEISGNGQGVVYLDMVSLMPDKTWKGHGLRADLAQSLEDLHPRFMRFPGGCWVEGDDFAHMNHWKETVGNIDSRRSLWNIWGYNATQGLGFHEYLQLAEDLGAEPLFCINAGMSHKETVPMDRMSQWVQDALDAIEYANGPTNSVWGAMRAAAGHPAPFGLEHLEIGNENGGFAGYVERWRLFYNAIHARYPDIKFVADGWDRFGDEQPDLVDDHFYDTPEWFMRHASQYDGTDRKGPKVFVGEYAATKKCGMGNLRGAIGEAAFMTGLERNSDVVKMASYAPLLANVNHRAWVPDLISFDSTRWYGGPSYYVQRMFAENRGDVYLPTEAQSPVIEAGVMGGQIGVGTWNTAAEFKDLRVTAANGRTLLASAFGSTNGWALLGEGAKWSVGGGVLRQTAEKEFLRALAGDPNWKDYTLTLKARKLSGAEGFLILFHADPAERRWWNIGGWNNTRDGIESEGTLDAKPSHIEANHWYDIKVTVTGKHVRCWLDGNLIHDLDFLGGGINSLYATAARDEETGDIIIKVVNTAEGPLETEIDLPGGKRLTGKGSATVLTSASPSDENSLTEPTKVSPRTGALAFSGTSLIRTFPGNSLTVLRLKTK